VKEIRPGVHFIKAENRGCYPYSNSLFLEGKVNLLIDTGAGSFLKEISGKTGQVVLSHYHRHYGQKVLLYFEREMIRKHLESLLDKGMVTKTEDGCYEAL